MPSKRELACERARIQNALERQAARRAAEMRETKLKDVFVSIGEILNHDDFVMLARKHGVISAPRCLTELENTTGDLAAVDASSECARRVSTFIVAWKFLCSIMQEQEIRELIENRWPNFVRELKDVFIGIVTNGPFPGERKRTLPSSHRL